VKAIESTTIINAPPERVWAIITDFARYREWNPFITELAGEPVLGARLRATFTLAGQKPRTFTPTIIDATPNRRLAWHGQLRLPKLFDADHSFAIEPHGVGCRFVHREEFRGVLVPIVRRTIAATHEAFLAMDAALASRAEAEATITG
jgi:hypothetical protein